MASRAIWFRDELVTISEPAREIFEKHSGIQPELVLKHIKQVRDKAYDIFPYPCIGGFYFLDLGTVKASCYPEVQERVRKGEKFLDIGCCFGQELRRLATDGVPTANLYGCDLRSEFIDIGYDLFLDKERFASTFIIADVLEDGTQLMQLKGQLGIIHAQYFFHLFAWEKQFQIAKQLVQLFKPDCDYLIFGGHMGKEKQSEVYHPDTGEFFVHSHESWNRLWKEVGEATGTSWEVDIVREAVEPSLLFVCGPDAYFMSFIVRKAK